MSGGGQPFAPITPFAAGENGCGCAACWRPDPTQGEWGPMFRVMHVCGDCGNKRCPRATHHAHHCTGSNEPGQSGSSYGLAPRYPLAPEDEADEQELQSLLAEVRAKRGATP